VAYAERYVLISALETFGFSRITSDINPVSHLVWSGVAGTFLVFVFAVPGAEEEDY